MIHIFVQKVDFTALDVFFFQAEDGIRDKLVTGVQTCALPISQRLARVAPASLLGSSEAFKDLADSRDQIDLDLVALTSGEAASGTAAAGPELQALVQQLQEKWKSAQAAASLMIAQRKNLSGFGELVVRINEATSRMQELAEGVLNSMVQRGAAPREVAAAGQLLALTQAIGRSANSMISGASAG